MAEEGGGGSPVSPRRLKQQSAFPAPPPNPSEPSSPRRATDPPRATHRPKPLQAPGQIAEGLYRVEKRDGKLGLGITAELVIKSVREDGPAYEAGIPPGDRIVAINGIGLASREEYMVAVQNASGPVVLKLEKTPGTAHHDGRAGYGPESARHQTRKEWACKTCTFVNAAQEVKCVMCGRQRQVDAAGMWECPHCTYHNQGGVVCAMCGGAMAGKGWQCKQCTFDNTEDAVRCAMCGASYPVVSSPTSPVRWTRRDDDRLRELRDKGPTTAAEEEEYQRLSRGYERFVEKGVGNLTPRNTMSGSPTPTGSPAPSSTSSVSPLAGSVLSRLRRLTVKKDVPPQQEWTRAEDNRLRELNTRVEKQEPLSEEEQKELDSLQTRFELFIEDGLRQMSGKTEPKIRRRSRTTVQQPQETLGDLDATCSDPRNLSLGSAEGSVRVGVTDTIKTKLLSKFVKTPRGDKDTQHVDPASGSIASRLGSGRSRKSPMIQRSE